MPRVLIIEDTAAVLDSIVLDLQMRGYEVMTAPDGKAALELLQTADDLPDVIVSDIAMPNMDGYQLLEALQQSPDLQTIPFIYLTAFNSPGAIRAGKEMGADDYLVKPFKIEDLVVAIDNKLRRAMQYRAGEARKMDKARRELLRLISHELRTPLTSIYGGADMLMKNIQGLPDDMSKHLLTIVRTGAKRMNRLIGQILMLVQLDSGAAADMLARQARPCDINSLVQQAFNTALKDSGKTASDTDVTFQQTEQPLPVEGLQEYLLAAFGEVLRNALVFEVPVVVSLYRDNQEGVLTVQDAGPGIPADMVATVWERFVQVDHPEIDRQGSGLGLALVREIVRLHRGSVALESREGQGTLVTIRLPLVAQDSKRLQAPE